VGKFSGQQWELREGEQLIGTITITDQDFPWLSGSFAPEPGFARWEPVFVAEEALLKEVSVEDSEEGWERWERLYDPIRKTLTLVSPSGPVAEFLLHIEGDAAWFRWSDEPFDDVS
jgi:hypothetical protein